MHYIEIRFFHIVLWVKKYFRHSTSSFVFVHKQTSIAIICSDWPITVQLSSRFPARKWTCFIWRQFLAPEKYGRLMTSWLVPETGQCVITTKLVLGQLHNNVVKIKMQKCTWLRVTITKWVLLWTTTQEIVLSSASPIRWGHNKISTEKKIVYAAR